MPTRTLASLTAAASLVFAATPALAQTSTSSDTSSVGASAGASATASGPMTSDEAAGQSTTAHNAGNPSSDDLLMSHGVSYSVGWRFWIHGIPAGIVNLFVGATQANGQPWQGTFANVATGPEFVYRKDNLDIALGIMYVGYAAPSGFFRAQNDPPEDTELIGGRAETNASGMATRDSNGNPTNNFNFWGLYVTSHFLWGIRLHRMFEIQVGLGIGIGYIGGDMTRSQAYRDASGTWHDCQSASGGPGSFCSNNPNNHYSGPSGSGYIEPTWAGNGSVPVVLPWISLPQVGFHFRPHRNIDIRADVGYGLITVYGGLSAHYVF